MSDSKTTELAINTIRCLAADVVQKANSGHPGMPMGMAPVAHVLWSKFLKFNPKNPKWWNRDRFVLSNGHGCALLYIMLHLSGYAVEMKDLQNFRQLGSITPGHPEKHLTPGIEVTTGPLGQGIANAVGLAIAESHLAAVFNKPGFTIFDNYTYVFLGDGCLQEGISHEACSLAGHLGLGKLIAIYDDNHITIDGDTALSFTEDVPKRFEAYGWHTLSVSGGDHDTKAIEAAIRKAQEVKDKPTIICLRTTIGFGATKQGTGGVHGEALGDAEVKKVKTKFGFDPEKKFFVPDEVRAVYGKKTGEGKSHEDSWKELFGKYKEAHPKEAQELIRRFDGKFPENWKSKFPKFTPKDKAVATRQLSQDALNAAAAVLPELIGGSADLTGSNKTNLKDYPVDYQKKTPAGRYFRFGVREHGMAAIGNGINAYGGLIPYTATFLNFIEYAFPAVRLAALSEHQQLFVMTHDSIGLGEDGPTHQPTEALSLCRATPNLLTFRPADGNETMGSYWSALEFKHGPSVLALSRQNLPHLEGSEPSKVAFGGYVLKDAPSPQVIFVATGSEVHLAVNAAKLLETKHGLKVRVVSMPCTELFEKQPLKYRRDTIIPGVPTISIEALGPLGWERYSHFQLALKEWGASAPLEQVMDHFGFTPVKVAASTLKILTTLKETAKELNLSDALLLPIHFRAAL